MLPIKFTVLISIITFFSIWMLISHYISKNRKFRIVKYDNGKFRIQTRHRWFLMWTGEMHINHHGNFCDYTSNDKDNYLFDNYQQAVDRINKYNSKMRKEKASRTIAEVIKPPYFSEDEFQ